MRSLLLLFVGAVAAFPQSIRFGLKGGMPFTDFTSAVSSGTINWTDNTRNYIVGPTFEVRLPFGLAIEVDALYRRFNYNQYIGGTAGTTHVSTSGNALGISAPCQVPIQSPGRPPLHRRRSGLGHPLRPDPVRPQRRRHHRNHLGSPPE